MQGLVLAVVRAGPVWNLPSDFGEKRGVKMGGLGSGRRWHLASKDATSSYREVDVRRWYRDGLLLEGRAFGWQWSRAGEVQASIRVKVEVNRVILCYRHRAGGAEWKEEEYPVFLTWTGCNLGGRRPWFICPAKGCGRRVAILYGGGIFACRHCYALAYPSQRETAVDRAVRRADGIRLRFGWEAGILNPNGDRPKGMHWRTYLRLLGEYEHWANLALAGMMQQLGVLQERVGDLVDRLPQM